MSMRSVPGRHEVLSILYPFDNLCYLGVFHLTFAMLIYSPLTCPWTIRGDFYLYPYSSYTKHFSLIILPTPTSLNSSVAFMYMFSLSGRERGSECVCVCACVRACVHARARVCVCDRETDRQTDRDREIKWV